MATIVHLSDFHFGWPYDLASGEAVLRAVDEIAPDAVVVSGDLVQRGDFGRLWRAARDYLARLARRPMLAVPGNHDIPLWNPLLRVLRPFASWRRHIGEETEPVLHVPGAVIAGICTPRWWILDLGYVSSAQLARVRRAFESAPARALRVVAMHHGLCPQKAAGIARHHVWGCARAVRALVEIGADVVLTGHNHYPHVEVLAEGRRGPVVQAQAGTACSTRYRPAGARAPNSINVVRGVDGGFEVEHLFFDRANGRFARAPTSKPARFQRSREARFDSVGSP